MILTILSTKPKCRMTFSKKFSLNSVVSFAHVKLESHKTQLPLGLSLKIGQSLKGHKNLLGLGRVYYNFSPHFKLYFMFKIRILNLTR